MNLHHTSEVPDWEKLPAAKQTRVHKIAAKTHGILTPPNLISLLGLGMVMYGLWMIISDQLWLGLTFVVIGRVLDLADGVVAEATHTKSPLGELVDASSDKLATALSVMTLLVADVASWSTVVILLAPQLLIALVSFMKRRRGIRTQPGLVGKISMALLWVAVAGLLFTSEVSASTLLRYVTYVAIALSAILGCIAAWQYIRKKD